MATVGQQLISPETGWKRIDDSNINIIYGGTWTVADFASYYGGYSHQSYELNASVKFNFTGTKLRLICEVSPSWTMVNTIKIDGVSYTFACNSGTGYQYITFEKIDLTDSQHFVEILVGTGSQWFKLDAIDIAETASILTYNSSYWGLHPERVKTSLADMQIGDAIVCGFHSGNGSVFYGLGTATDAEVPFTGLNNTGQGIFYFIKVDKGLLIADRIVRNTIDWTWLNNTKLFIEGALLSACFMDSSYGSLQGMIRSLSGGCTWRDANGNKVITFPGAQYGGFPVTNEYDKYLVESDLNGKVTPNDDNIWHGAEYGTFCKETPIISGTTASDRMLRGTSGDVKTISYTSYNSPTANRGFRPVLEYMEPDGSSKQTTLWY